MRKLTSGVTFVLLGLTVVMTFLGAVGSICVSWFPEQYDFPMLVPYKPVYQTATIFTFVAGGLGLAGLVGVWRRKPWAVKALWAALVLGLLTAGTKMAFSARLRGSTAPTNMRFYLTLVTLLAWWAWGQPLRARADDHAAERDQAPPVGPATLAVLELAAGLVVLTTRWWAGPTHLIRGVNWVDVLAPHLALAGVALLAAGLWHTARVRSARFRLGEPAWGRAPLPVTYESRPRSYR